MAGLEGSPIPGSPTGSVAGGAVDGAEIARRMVQAVEASVAAAKAAVEAVSRKPEDRNWFRILPKPPNFDPRSREEEIAQWRDFSWSLEQYLSSMDSNFIEDIKELRSNPGREIEVALQSDEERQRSSFLYALLASLLCHRPLSLIKQVKESNGLEAYRVLIHSLEPTSKNRSLELLTMILEWGQFDMRKGSILNQLLKLEEAYAEYEKTGARLDETIKFATLMRCVGGQLKTWLQLQVAETQSYSRLREAIIQYDHATTKWSSAMILSQDTGGPAPMEIDRITEKGKGKGKSKGKDGGPGKGKGKGDQKGTKGKGKAPGKGQEGGKIGQKGQKADGKGKTKESPIKTCFTCGKPGHMAKDCWRVVRQVEASSSASQGETSSTTHTHLTDHDDEDPIHQED